ncbi:hypothetical protein BDY21DRAFT_344816 [Lineolata rhizophorae]|uniref:Uncharacterized protein n=1 Tax=Lineolata rhizophorae TaxID=578093 RepID=A0A6A6NZ93_9PEZI|nr:hypothetical protein BDY21DRAFT_344816 [Lineolata rhizophorae]
MPSQAIAPTIYAHDPITIFPDPCFPPAPSLRRKHGLVLAGKVPKAGIWRSDFLVWPIFFGLGGGGAGCLCYLLVPSPFISPSCCVPAVAARAAPLGLVGNALVVRCHLRSADSGQTPPGWSSKPPSSHCAAFSAFLRCRGAAPDQSQSSSACRVCSTRPTRMTCSKP